MFVSLCYVVFRRLFQIVALRMRSNDWKELEIVVRRHELAILRRQTTRPAMTTVDRLFLASRLCLVNIPTTGNHSQTRLSRPESQDVSGFQ